MPEYYERVFLDQEYAELFLKGELSLGTLFDNHENKNAVRELAEYVAETGISFNMTTSFVQGYGQNMGIEANYSSQSDYSLGNPAEVGDKVLEIAKLDNRTFEDRWMKINDLIIDNILDENKDPAKMDMQDLLETFSVAQDNRDMPIRGFSESMGHLLNIDEESEWLKTYKNFEKYALVENAINNYQEVSGAVDNAVGQEISSQSKGIS